ncbi:MAG: flagellar protein FliT [Brevibacillus sp.]|nr:flagellar protein FliT [Brevibacillus sp.]
MSALPSLCKRLLETTLELEAVVGRPDSDAESWDALLEERERIMEQISALVAGGEVLPQTLREEYLEKAETANRRLLTRMEARKDAVYEQIGQLKRTKQARRQYADTGPNPYGAFFDQRK